MYYRKPVARRTVTLYEKKFDWVYFWGGIIGAIVVLALMGG